MSLLLLLISEADERIERATDRSAVLSRCGLPTPYGLRAPMTQKLLNQGAVGPRRQHVSAIADVLAVYGANAL